MAMLLTVELPGAADLEAAAQRLAVPVAKLDAQFGVVPVDPDNHLYSVMVEDDAAPGASARSGVSGPYSNPRIEPFR